MSTTPSTSAKWPDLLGLALISIVALNLNSVYFLFTGTEAVFSPLVLLLTAILIVKYFNTYRITGFYALFLLTIFFYLTLAWIAGLTTFRNDNRYFSAYFSTVLLVSAVYFWLIYLDEPSRRKVLVALKYLLLISCVFVILSDKIAPYLLPPQVDETQTNELAAAMNTVVRASGFFANPNEAAMAALYCIVLIAAVPSRGIHWRILQFAVGATALIMTFSKAGMLTLLFLAAVFLLAKRSLLAMLLLAISAALLWLALWYILDQDLLSLSTEQRARLVDAISLASGEINQRTTTGRSILLEIGFDRIRESFPWGWGLGQFHAMEGGLRAASSFGEFAKWQGVHNTFVMVLGEAGPIPLLMLLAFLAGALAYGMRSPHRSIIVGFTIVLIVDMLTTHHVLQIRLTNVTVAVVLALLAASARAKSNVPARPKPARIAVT
ncbi:MAG TPA: O-antigen ligase family protein [Microvirga sp.]|nr:O-antigen ligase family protein [Microvirga sp.]